MLVLEAMLAPMIALQTASQLSEGISFRTGEIAGPMAGFVLLAGAAVWMLVGTLRCVRGPAIDVGAGYDRSWEERA
jgi:hypothetical protein